jgi:hypothetical protein
MRYSRDLTGLGRAMRLISFIRRHGLALFALFVALGGTSYAAVKISGAQIENRSITGKKLKRGTLGRVPIKESRLGKVPRAHRADRLGRFTAAGLRLRCPSNTEPVSGVCAETGTRRPAAYGIARVECDSVNRRLPTYEELANLVSSPSFALAAGGELTSSVFSKSGSLQVVTVISEGGATNEVADTGSNARPFRCVAYPRN